MNTSPAVRARTLFRQEGRIRPFWLLLLYPPVLLVTAAVVMLPLMLLFELAGISSAAAQTPLALAGPVRRTLDVLLMVVVLVGGTWVWWRLIGKHDWAAFGLSFHSGWLRELGSGLLFGGAAMFIIFFVEQAAGWLSVTGYAWDTRLGWEVVAAFYLAVLGTIEVAVTEEIVSRGYFLQAFRAWLGLPAAIILSSLIFGLLHLLNPTAVGWIRYLAPAALTLLGVVFALAYLARRSLWLPIGLHFSWNLFEYHVFGLAGTRPQEVSLFRTNVTGPSIFVGLPGTSFGPELGLLGLLSMTILVLVLLKMWRKESICYP